MISLVRTEKRQTGWQFMVLSCRSGTVGSLFIKVSHWTHLTSDLMVGLDITKHPIVHIMQHHASVEAFWIVFVAKSETKGLKEEMDRMLKLKGNTCCRIVHKQKKIAMLETESSTLSKVLPIPCLDSF